LNECPNDGRDEKARALGLGFESSFCRPCKSCYPVLRGSGDVLRSSINARSHVMRKLGRAAAICAMLLLSAMIAVSGCSHQEAARSETDLSGAEMVACRLESGVDVRSVISARSILVRYLLSARSVAWSRRRETRYCISCECDGGGHVGGRISRPTCPHPHRRHALPQVRTCHS